MLITFIIFIMAVITIGYMGFLGRKFKIMCEMMMLLALIGKKRIEIKALDLQGRWWKVRDGFISYVNGDF
jgi:hypothetical protein